MVSQPQLELPLGLAREDVADDDPPGAPPPPEVPHQDPEGTDDGGA